MVWRWPTRRIGLDWTGETGQVASQERDSQAVGSTAQANDNNGAYGKKEERATKRGKAATDWAAQGQVRVAAVIVGRLNRVNLA